ncbi:MAG: hypothetical protein ACI37T_04550, partial [Candidatus Gastranaerophilaceae bacterium]
MGSNTQVQSAEQSKSAYSAENIRAYSTAGINTGLSSDEVKQKYSELSSVLEPETRVALSGLLKSGVLLNNNSNDGSTVLDNLHKIITEPRIRGLNAKTLVTEAIDEISNPGKITQTFGDVPDSVSRAVFRHPELGVRSKEEMDIGNYSNCCVAASIEYNIASRTPAEFARMAAGFSSEDYSVSKDLKLTDIAEKRDDAMWLLEKFKLPYSIDDNDNIKVTIEPDRNAIIRARVQTSYRDEGERSSLDVLMQSALMNIGSQQSYNSLNDKRVGMFSNETTGLTPIEKTFVEEVATGTSKVPVIYQAIGEDGTIQELACDYETMAQQLVTALQTDNVIVGYVDFNQAGQVIGGHEITIIDAGESPTGDLVFVCNDTADGNDEPIYILAQNLLPRLNHADLPKTALGDTPMPTQFDGIPYYKERIG